MLIPCDNPEAVAKRAFFLAYQAAGGPSGMGWMQARDGATEDDVWNNVKSAGDYPGGKMGRPDGPGEAYGDYVFGRMVKLGLRWSDQGVEVRDSEPRRDYQAWCGTYPTYESLVRAATASFSEPVAVG